MTDTNYNFSERCVKLGVVTLLGGIMANFIPCLYLWIRYDAIPPFADILKIWGLVASVYGISWLVQPISFFPLMGTAGSYVGWLSGSVADIKSPASAMAHKVAEYGDGTQESEIVRTMGLIVATFVCVALTTVFAFAGAQIVAMLPDAVRRAFAFMLPAVFGAVYADLSSKNLRSGILTILFAFGSLSYVPIPGWTQTLLIVASGITIANLIYEFDSRKK
ncbi:hypothetical protein FACS1894187_06020 [Synergistales bacterium]|nr:hypothetical protein FACS1894187_06020 [Synergistales bacterium]